MEKREIIRGVINQFFLIFTIIMIAMLSLERLSAVEYIHTNNIIGVLILAALTSLASLVLYSKKEQRRAEARVRSAIHLVIVMVLATTIATIFRWLRWNSPAEVAVWLALFLVVYAITSAVDYFQTKKLADNLNERLRQRYKS